MIAPIRILAVDDSEDDVMLVARHLRKADITGLFERVDEPEAMRAALLRSRWDVVLCDYSMPEFDAIRALRLIASLGLDVPVIVVSGAVGEEAAADCMREGAHDLVLKGNLSRLAPAILRELAEAVARAEQARVREQLRASEETLVRSERLRALGQMAAGVVHDLRNVINPMSLYAQMAERALEQNDTARASEALASARNVLRRGLEVIDRLRAFSRQSEDGEPALVELNRLAHEAVSLAHPRIASRAASASSVVEQFGPPATVSARGGDVISAILNLIVNAIEAMPDGGTVTVRTGGTPTEPWVEVADNGPGIPAEIQQHVFEPFFTTKGDQGTGLGLAMVYSCMSRHGGSVVLTSTPGKGATFRLTFPTRVDRQTAPVAAAVEPVPMAGAAAVGVGTSQTAPFCNAPR